MIPIQFTNTLTRKKEPFVPRKQGEVSLYVCGVTPYAHSHIGHGRSYVNFDVLVRFLRLVGFNVTYVRNVTDIDDKLLNKAEAEFGDQMKYAELARKFTAHFHEDMRALNNIDADIEPLATEHIDQMIDFISAMIQKGDAYVAGHDVYFDVSRAAHYGQLSGKKLDELQAGARIKVNEQKKHPADFVLWKGNDQGLFWKAPWGHGRPGWHIECSAMAHHYFGATLDMHGGGADLIFPHHENEIAQSQSVTEQTFANVWLHNALLNIDTEKMSKSLGNTYTLHEIFKKFDPMVLRFYFLQHHYRTPIEFQFEHLDAAGVGYKKLVKAFEGLPAVASSDKSSVTLGKSEGRGTEHAQATLQEIMDNPIGKKIIDALADDLNTSRATAVVFEHLDEIKNDAATASLLKFLVRQTLGLTLEPLAQDRLEITPEIQVLLDEREQARAAKDWVRADAVRDQLYAKGYKPQDKKA